jgi:hypothetical protein
MLSFGDGRKDKDNAETEEVRDLAFRLLVKEPLMVVLPSDHRLAALKNHQSEGPSG